MKILLTDIIEKGDVFTFLETVDSFYDGCEIQISVQNSIKVIQQKRNMYTLAGVLKAPVVSRCDRCGKKIRIELDRHYEYILQVGEAPEFADEYQCSDEDCETLYLAEASIESKEIISEQLMLALPVHRLCDTGCKGLCKACGVDLNIEKCQCEEDNTNSPFAILRTLQKK